MTGEGAGKASKRYRSKAQNLLYFGKWQVREQEKQDSNTEAESKTCPTSVNIR